MSISKAFAGYLKFRKALESTTTCGSLMNPIPSHAKLRPLFDARAAYHPRGIEIGTHRIELTDAATKDPLFAATPQRFDALLVHAQSVLKLPACAQSLGRNVHEAHQIFRIGRCAWGVQFHPEFDAATMRAYIFQMQAQLERHGVAWRAIQDAVQETPHASPF
jgi:GMP synthase (glutamine-hydrolysing)